MFLLTGLIACGQEAEQPPTSIATAFLPTSAPTELAPTLPPTAEAAQVAPTQAFTPTPVIPPTPARRGRGALNITSPTENSTILTGSTLTVSGLSRVAADQSLQVRLVSVNGLLLAQTMAQVQDNTFQAQVTVPITITGAAQIQAQVLDGAGMVLVADALP
ncbi:MAG: hypothetical protein IPL78_24805 [Chloroflexi bacterium]|nr:hypothetical protein [Chloroflexota bacterium]